jgi:ABC-type transport system substrate-binding protein
MVRHSFVWLIMWMMIALMGVDEGAASQPEGALVIAFDTSIAATYLDPAETPGLQTPFVFLYALHDALIKPLPGNDMAPCLAESWTETPDGLLYEFKLREGLSFHDGNAAARIETYVVSTGTYAYGGHADIDDLFRQQAPERDRTKREALLHQIQRLMHERVMHAPIYEPATIHGVGPRVQEPAVGLNTLLYFTAPYEEIRLNKP